MLRQEQYRAIEYGDVCGVISANCSQSNFMRVTSREAFLLIKGIIYRGFVQRERTSFCMERMNGPVG